VVLAIAEAARQDRLRIIGNMSAVAENDRHIPYILRDPIEKCQRLRTDIVLVSGEVVSQVANFLA
jgi:hypothetical protein